MFSTTLVKNAVGKGSLLNELQANKHRNKKN